MLTICILAPESTTNSLSSGSFVDAAGRLALPRCFRRHSTWRDRFATRCSHQASLHTPSTHTVLSWCWLALERVRLRYHVVQGPSIPFEIGLMYLLPLWENGCTVSIDRDPPVWPSVQDDGGYLSASSCGLWTVELVLSSSGLVESSRGVGI